MSNGTSAAPNSASSGGASPSVPALGNSETNGRREELVHKAAHLFRTKGFKGTTTRDIASAMGMRSGSPFYYFDSKGALLCAVMQTGMEIASVSQDEILKSWTKNTSPKQRLRDLVHGHLRALLDVGRDFMPVLTYEWPWLTVEQRQAVAKQKDDYEAAWMPTLKSLYLNGEIHSRPEIARFFIFGALNWMVYWFNPKGPLKIEDLTTEAMNFFID